MSTAEEFSGVDTAPGDPRHVQQVIDHIAHLEDEQVAEIRGALNRWRQAAEAAGRGEVDRDSRCTCPMAVRENMRNRVYWPNRAERPETVAGRHHANRCPLWRAA